MITRKFLLPFLTAKVYLTLLRFYTVFFGIHLSGPTDYRNSVRGIYPAGKVLEMASQTSLWFSERRDARRRVFNPWRPIIKLPRNNLPRNVVPSAAGLPSLAKQISVLAIDGYDELSEFSRTGERLRHAVGQDRVPATQSHFSLKYMIRA